MKGDDFINSVELYFFGLGCNDLYQANIKIYDGKHLIVNKKTYNGKVIVCLKPDKKYLLIAESNFSKIISYLNITSLQNKYYYIFSNAYCNATNNRIITFLLTDYNYVNLPIEKGEMVIWQK